MSPITSSHLMHQNLHQDVRRGEGKGEEGRGREDTVSASLCSVSMLHSPILNVRARILAAEDTQHYNHQEEEERSHCHTDPVDG